LSKQKVCSHGRTFAERCIGCELVLAREGLEYAKERAEIYTRQIERLEAEELLIGQYPR